MMRALWVTAGIIATALGVAGLFLPLLPGVAFLLLAAFCFARGSRRLHDWLLTHPRLGPPIDEWYRHGAIRRPAKRMAVLAIGLSFIFPVAFGAPVWVTGLQTLALGAVVAFILTRPEGPKA